jgi:tight adherence protein C
MEPVIAALLAASCASLVLVTMVLKTDSRLLARVGIARAARLSRLVKRLGVVRTLVVVPGPWLRLRSRAVEADAEIPQLLDLLAAASSAGLSGQLALRRAREVVSGPLAEELGVVVRAVDLGGRWRDELRKLAERLDLRDLRRTVAAMTRAETLGSSLADALTELADQVRAARRAAMGERARRAPVKMLFPLVFMVLPAFLLLTVVPVLIATLRSIG